MKHLPATKNPYIIDIEEAAETARLIEQSQLFTAAMGGVFPAELDLSQVVQVLDLACGPGEWARQVAFEYPEMQVVGVDINQTMVGYANAFARVTGRPNLSYEPMDILEPLEFWDEAFDLIHARFLVGVLNPASWPGVRAYCRR